MTPADIYDEYHKHGAFSVGAVSKEYMSLLNEYGVYDGTNKYCVKILCYPETEIRDGTIKKKFEVLDTDKGIDQIEGEWGEIVLKSFEIDIDALKRSKNLLLSNSIGYITPVYNLDGGNEKHDPRKQSLMYQKLVDYYLNVPLCELTVKGHPYNWIKWEDVFKGSTVLNADFLIELIKLCKGLRIEKTVSIASSGNLKIMDCIDKNIIATADFARCFQHLDILYTICRIYLSISCRNKLNAFGLPCRWSYKQRFFDSFLKNVMNDEIGNWSCSDKYDFKPTESFFGIYHTPYFSREINSILGLSRAMDENSAFAVFPVSEEIPVYTWPQFVLDGISVFRIERTPLREDILQPLKDEYIWIFSKSQEIRNKIEQCYVEKNCEASGVVVKSRALTAYEKKLYFDNYKLKNEVCTLRYKNEIIQRFRQGRNDLQSINSIDEYLIALSQMDNIAVFIAVMGNAGRSYISKTVRLIEDLGLKIHWNHLGWNSYIAVVDSAGISEQRGERGKPLAISGETSGIQYNMSSKSYTQGDDAVIKLNGVDYAVKARGINVVVYDKVQRKVIDSVCFNPFGNEISFSRRYL